MSNTIMTKEGPVTTVQPTTTETPSAVSDSSREPSVTRVGKLGWSAHARRTRSTVLGFIGVLGFLATWEFVSRAGLLRNDLPPASATLARAGELMVDPDFLTNVGDTLWAAAVGFGAAFLIAVPAGLMLGMSDRLYSLTSTVVELLRPLPPIALVPLMVLIAGQGLEMKAVIVAIGCVWPLLINTIHGVHGTDGTAIATGRSFGWNRVQIIRRVIWHSAVPSILTGVRITVSIAVILCVGAEYIGGSTTGIGSWLLQQSSLPQGMEAVCAGVIVAGVIGVLVNGVVSILEQRFAGWATKEEPA